MVYHTGRDRARSGLVTRPHNGKLLHRRLERISRAEREMLNASLEQARYEASSIFHELRAGDYSLPAPNPEQDASVHIAYREGRERLERLLRFETQLERSVFRTLHELERLQALRAGQPVAFPMALDITVDQATTLEIGGRE